MDTYVEDEDQDFRRVRVNAQGRIVLPAEFRRALGIAPGSEVVISLDGDRLVIETPAGLLAAIQKLTSHIDLERSLVDELIADRRAAARREAEEMNAAVPSGTWVTRPEPRTVP